MLGDGSIRFSGSAPHRKCVHYTMGRMVFVWCDSQQNVEKQVQKRPPRLRCRASQFLDLCLLVGCDYITTSVKGLGIATAHKLVNRHRSLDKVYMPGAQNGN